MGRGCGRGHGLERRRRAVCCAARQLPSQRGERGGAEGDREGALDGAAAHAPQQQRLGAVGSAQQPPRAHGLHRRHGAARVRRGGEAAHARPDGRGGEARRQQRLAPSALHVPELDLGAAREREVRLEIQIGVEITASRLAGRPRRDARGSCLAAARVGARNGAQGDDLADRLRPGSRRAPGTSRRAGVIWRGSAYEPGSAAPLSGRPRTRRPRTSGVRRPPQPEKRRGASHDVRRAPSRDRRATSRVRRAPSRVRRAGLRLRLQDVACFSHDVRRSEQRRATLRARHK